MYRSLLVTAFAALAIVAGQLPAQEGCGSDACPDAIDELGISCIWCDCLESLLRTWHLKTLPFIVRKLPRLA
jgi:hypothetical protein